MIAAFTYAKRSDSLPHITARGSKTIVYTTPGPGRTGSGDCAAAEAVGMSQELYQRLLAASRNTAAFCNQATLQAVMAEISAGSAPEQVISSLEAANGTLDDLARKTTINTLHAGLKVYLQEHGGYPTAAQLSDETWLQANLSYVYNEVLSIAPGNTANSVTSNAEVTADAFSYIALDTLQQPSRCAWCNLMRYTPKRVPTTSMLTRPAGRINT